MTSTSPFDAWTPHHPDLRRDLIAALDPALRAALDDPDPDAIAALITHLGGDLYTVPMLTEDACARLCEDLDGLEAWAEAHDVALERPNSMNHYGVVLDDVGYREALGELVMRVVRPLTRALFADFGAATLDHHHGFVVEYALDGDLDLGFHVDDSEVTVNLCLGERFEGGELYFAGTHCMRHCDAPIAPEAYREVEHAPGVALLHSGAHRHGATPLQAGVRRNLILWCRSSAWRRAHSRFVCAPWCASWRGR